MNALGHQPLCAGQAVTAEGMAGRNLLREKTFPEVCKADLTQFAERSKNENRKDQKHFSYFVVQTVCVLFPSVRNNSGVHSSDFM